MYNSQNARILDCVHHQQCEPVCCMLLIWTTRATLQSSTSKHLNKQLLQESISLSQLLNFYLQRIQLGLQPLYNPFFSAEQCSDTVAWFEIGFLWPTRNWAFASLFECRNLFKGLECTSALPLAILNMFRITSLVLLHSVSALEFSRISDGLINHTVYIWHKFKFFNVFKRHDVWMFHLLLCLKFWNVPNAPIWKLRRQNSMYVAHSTCMCYDHRTCHPRPRDVPLTLLRLLVNDFSKKLRLVADPENTKPTRVELAPILEFAVHPTLPNYM